MLLHRCHVGAALVPSRRDGSERRPHKRQRFLWDEPVRKALRESIQETRQSFPFKVEAWVLLPGPLHCIWTLPPNHDDFSIRGLLIKGGVSKRGKEYENPALLSNSRVERGESSLWQRRFWEHYLGDEQDLIKHLDYVHFNPVKHGYVEQPRDWRYSTFRRCVARGLYRIDCGAGVTFEGEFGDVDD